MSFIKEKIDTIFIAVDARSAGIKRNIFYSLIIKGASVLIGFLLVPITISYLNEVQYGIWITIASLVAWINTFDIGLSNGLRNKLAQANATGDTTGAVQLVSTTYALLFTIGVAVFAFFAMVGSFFNWNHILNIPASVNYNIWPVFMLTLGAFCLQFALQPLNSILTALHQPFKASLILFIGQLLTLILVCLIGAFSNGNLLLLVGVVAGSPVLALLIANALMFYGTLKPFAPRLNAVTSSSARSLLGIGSIFFLIQIGALVLYETDNIVISATLGPQFVTVFNIPFKYFSIINIIFSIIITPYWSAFTDAYARNDFEWIKQSLKKLRLIWLSFAVVAVLLYLLADIAYKMWIKDIVEVPDILSLMMMIYTMVQTWMLIHAYLLNGTGKLRVQLILVIITGIINIPLSIWLIKLMGLHGTVISNIVVMLLMSVFLTWQSRLVVTKRATGIWDK